MTSADRYRALAVQCDAKAKHEADYLLRTLDECFGDEDDRIFA